MNLMAFCEETQRRLGAIDADTAYDDRDILAVADGCRGMLFDDYFRQYGELPEGDYIRPYVIELKPDSATGLMKFKLPVTIANGVNNMGIRSITNTKAPFTNWVPLKTGTSSQYKEEDYGGRVVYWLEGQTVMVQNSTGTTSARILLIPNLLELDTDDEILGGSGMEGQIMDMVVQKMLIKRDTPETNINDGSDNK